MRSTAAVIGRVRETRSAIVLGALADSRFPGSKAKAGRRSPNPITSTLRGNCPAATAMLQANVDFPSPESVEQIITTSDEPASQPRGSTEPRTNRIALVYGSCQPFCDSSCRRSDRPALVSGTTPTQCSPNVFDNWLPSWNVLSNRSSEMAMKHPSNAKAMTAGGTMKKGLVEAGLLGGHAAASMRISG